jgi:hypothetical protein
MRRLPSECTAIVVANAAVKFIGSFGSGVSADSGARLMSDKLAQR